MSKCYEHTKLSETLTLSQCNDGYWLYDKTRGMNLGMRCNTPQDALVECITYYQERLTEVEHKHRELTNKVNDFVAQFTAE